jgi:hypothetical protein
MIDFPFFRYIPKGMREPWQRQGTLNRRYNKYAPKLQVPLKVGGLVATNMLPSFKFLHILCGIFTSTTNMRQNLVSHVGGLITTKMLPSFKFCIT